ncbi:YHYH protein [Hymenobacter negativus]|uniref:YHYH protein n=1 Tax=Hymenobacter negativus TaxID=2795026 RepID=A0ABS3QCX6_9BACT|nr:YHYH protein [Hymenobacter negativus]MBO2009061.1 YHYH protein [Hymenobacter negativus]
MKHASITLLALLARLCLAETALGQATNPAITKFLQNTTNVRGRHYVSGNATPIQDTAHANVQRVRYSATAVYVNCSGIPAYVIGPYLDNNPSLATNRQNLFKLPLTPRPNTGVARAVTGGNIGVLINGVPIYNYADGMSYQNQGVWRQNAVVFERGGFDCSKGHPAPVFLTTPGPGVTPVGGNYHHHQNPSAFNIATVPLSTVCNIYLADGLYVPDSTRHAPLIGFAFDGYPIYGGYGYTNPLAVSAIKRMVPSFRKRNITARTTLPNGSAASQVGPTLAAQALGSYFEDYEQVAGLGNLDDHNGRFCVTPEYPQGTYAYFATIDRDGNSVFPYVLGTTYYGVVEVSNFPNMGLGQPPTNVVINEPVTTYSPVVSATNPASAAARVTVYPSPTHEVLVVQMTLSSAVVQPVELLDLSGRVIERQLLFPGSTMCYFDTQALHAGVYLVRVNSGSAVRVVIE